LTKVRQGDGEIRSEQVEGIFAQEDHGWLVALDTRLDDNLIKEGIARDFIRNIANMRKDADFKVDDRINIWVDGKEKVKEAVNEHKEFISTENLARDISFDYEEKPHTFKTKIAGEEMRISLEITE